LPAFAPPARPRNRFRRRLLVGTLAGAALLAGLWVYFTLAWKWELQAAIAEADRLDPGWRFEDLEAAREPVPDAENSASIVLAVAAAVPARWGNILLPGPLSLEDWLAGLPLAQPPDEADLAPLRAARAKVTVAVDQARELADRPHGRYALRWTPDLVGTLVPHLDNLRVVARLLLVDALVRARDGDTEGAVRSCRALVNAGRSVGDEGATLSQIIRARCGRDAVQALELALASGSASEKSLEDMQALLTDEAAQPLFLRTMRGERVSYFQALEVARTVGLDRKNYNLRSSWLGPTADRFIDSDRARGSEAAFLRWTNALVEVAKSPTETHDEQLRKLPRPTQHLPVLIAALMGGDNTVTLASVFNRTHAELRSATVALAALRYRRDEHHWPERSDELVPRYLPAVPTDPFDGQPLRWRRLPDGIVIYSVGPDRTDNGGNVDRHYPPRPRTDLGFRLRDEPGRR
jgi:hypothetical protein